MDQRSINETSRLLGVDPNRLRQLLNENGVSTTEDIFDSTTSIMELIRENWVELRPESERKTFKKNAWTGAARPSSRNSNQHLPPLRPMPKTRPRTKTRTKNTRGGQRSQGDRPASTSGRWRSIKVPGGVIAGLQDSQDQVWISLATLASHVRDTPTGIAKDLRAMGMTIPNQRSRELAAHQISFRDALSLIDHRVNSARFWPHQSQTSSGTPSGAGHNSDVIPSTVTGIAERLRLPIGVVWRIAMDDQVPVRSVDQSIPLAYRESVFQEAQRSSKFTAPTTRRDPTPGDSPVPPTAPQQDAAAPHPPQPWVRRDGRLNRTDIAPLRAHLHHQGIVARGDAVRSTRAHVAFWADDEVLHALSNSETTTATSPSEGYLPPPGWLLFAQPTDINGNIGLGTVRGLSWTPGPGADEIQVYLWRDATAEWPDGPLLLPDPAVLLNLNQPWSANPVLALLHRWWTFLGSGWLEHQPTGGDATGHLANPTRETSATSTTRTPGPVVSYQTWRTPRNVSPHQTPREHRSQGVRKPPTLHTVREFYRWTPVGPGRQERELRLVHAHTRGGHQERAQTSASSDLVVYVLRLF